MFCLNNSESVRARGISQERHNILSPPPALQQLMHHNLNNNYVQYNFWWSKLTKTSLYQEIFVPTNKKPWPEFANLDWPILQNVAALKIAHWWILCLLVGAIIKNHHQLLMHIFERLAKSAIWV